MGVIQNAIPLRGAFDASLPKNLQADKEGRKEVVRKKEEKKNKEEVVGQTHSSDKAIDTVEEALALIQEATQSPRPKDIFVNVVIDSSSGVRMKDVVAIGNGRLCSETGGANGILLNSPPARGHLADGTTSEIPSFLATIRYVRLCPGEVPLLYSAEPELVINTDPNFAVFDSAWQMFRREVDAEITP